MSQYTELEIAQVEADRFIDKCCELETELSQERLNHARYKHAVVVALALLGCEKTVIVNGVEMIDFEKVKLMTNRIAEITIEENWEPEDIPLM